jgi:carboxyl-terminal processing protease
MRHIRLYRAVPTLFFLLVCFVIGFVAQDVVAGGGDFGKWVKSLELLPQRISKLEPGEAETPEDQQPLPVMETYSSVLERLKSDFYGKEINPKLQRELTYDAIRGMLTGLGDPFTRFMDPDEYKKMREENEGNFTGIGALLDTNKDGLVYIKEPLPDAPAMKAGVKANDIIIAVNGQSVKHVEIDKVVKLIRGPEGTVVKLTLQRTGAKAPVQISITRQIVQFQMVKWRMQNDKDKIGYIRLYQFNEQSDVQFDKALSALEARHMKGLILDLRGNPGGLLNIAVEIGSRFIDSGPVVIIQERGGQRNALNVQPSKHNHKKYPLVVLVDKSSASASEIVSGAIKDDGVGTLVGVTTFGKGRVQTVMPLQDGSAVLVTTAKYLTPNGTDIHKKGIEPDVKVEAADNFDPNDQATDVQLKKAVEVLKGKMGMPATAVNGGKTQQ